MNWHGLLVSVRNAGEAAEAIAGGADIIDVKEPRHGSLGPAEPEAVAAVARVVGQRRPWTMACGELRGPSAGTGVCEPAAQVADHVAGRWDRIRSLLPAGAATPAGVKIGLAASAGTAWRRDLLAVYRRLPESINRVAVAYADWERAAAPPPEDVIASAAGLGCSAVLIDTFDKSGPGLFGCCRPGIPRAWVAAARAAGLRVAVAGRIAAPEIPAAWALGADVVALRSAVCFNGRDGSVRAGLVRRAVGHGRPEPRPVPGDPLERAIRAHEGERA